jgi:hypothetical protein
MSNVYKGERSFLVAERQKKPFIKTEKSNNWQPRAGKRKILMNQQIHSEEHLIDETTTTNDVDMLVQEGFTSDEIMSMLWLRQWYQNGGSDRTEVIRHLEFIKLLVLNGKMAI